MARTIAAFFLLCTVALMAGALTVASLTFTGHSMMQIAALAPIRIYDTKPSSAATRLPTRQADEFNIAKSVPVVPVSQKTEAASAQPIFTVAVESLRVRSGPTRTSPQVFALAGGTRVTVSATERGWMLVAGPGGKTGWVYGKFLRPLVKEQAQAD